MVREQVYKQAFFVYISTSKHLRTKNGKSYWIVKFEDDKATINCYLNNCTFSEIILQFRNNPLSSVIAFRIISHVFTDTSLNALFLCFYDNYLHDVYNRLKHDMLFGGSIYVVCFFILFFKISSVCVYS